MIKPANKNQLDIIINKLNSSINETIEIIVSSQEYSNKLFNIIEIPPPQSNDIHPKLNNILQKFYQHLSVDNIGNLINKNNLMKLINAFEIMGKFQINTLSQFTFTLFKYG